MLASEVCNVKEDDMYCQLIITPCFIPMVLYKANDTFLTLIESDLDNYQSTNPVCLPFDHVHRDLPSYT